MFGLTNAKPHLALRKPSLGTVFTGVNSTLLDFTDATGLYQDQTLTALTAAGQSIGTVLDEAHLGYGPERITNGDFSSGLTGWIEASTAPSYVSVIGGVATWVTDGVNIARLRQAITTTVGATYLVSMSGSGVPVAIGTTAGASEVVAFALNNARPSFIFTATSTTTWFNCSIAANGATIDNVSIRQVLGIPSVQTANNSRWKWRTLPSGRGYAESDYVDDAIPLTLPTAANGELVLIGPNGCWRETRLAALGTSVTIGPTGTATTAGIVKALGGLHAVAYKQGGFTAAEYQWLCRRYGSKGPLVAGGELVSNGDFSSGLTGWNQVIGSVTATGGRLRVSRSGGVIGRAVSTAIPCVVGKVYQVTFDFYIGTLGNADWYIGISPTSSTGLIHAQGDGVNGRASFVFTATQTSHYIGLQASATGTDGQYTEYDNVSVKPLTPEW